MRIIRVYINIACIIVAQTFSFVFINCTIFLIFFYSSSKSTSNLLYSDRNRSADCEQEMRGALEKERRGCESDKQIGICGARPLEESERMATVEFRKEGRLYFSYCFSIWLVVWNRLIFSCQTDGG